MDNRDKTEFKALLDATSEYYQREPLSKLALGMYFAGLEAYELDQIQAAIGQHIQDHKSGEFYPKVSNILAKLEGGNMTTDQIIAEARLAKTPLGILCRIHIGTWDLKNQSDMFYLKQRAEECLKMLPEWKDRAKSGGYTDHEISIMLKHSVDPSKAFYTGLPVPSDREAITSRVEAVRKSDRHIYLLEQLEQEDPDESVEASEDVRKFISTMIQ